MKPTAKIFNHIQRRKSRKTDFENRLSDFDGVGFGGFLLTPSFILSKKIDNFQHMSYSPTYFRVVFTCNLETGSPQKFEVSQKDAEFHVEFIGKSHF